MPQFTQEQHPLFMASLAMNIMTKPNEKFVNCVEDSLYKPVGNDAANGQLAPSRLLSSTITDELKLFTQKRAKVVGVSMKDRGAILPAGHMADAAYWYDSKIGQIYFEHVLHE